ncbi:hypothetical protein O181_028519 [Austropuccinia psidii MF-1]|uniref:Uncharacterized protein n=1 Tax=Austropuccinia psidii MF-1 TaxID=1389203 RepID=A0A9Q3CP27_9BASI|nr:hypothetical protein [Austropuccinia psidii MF-1]
MKMVHTKNGSNYSIQPDGYGQGRGKTRARYGKYSSIKTCLEDARFSPHSPMSVPTNFDVNSEPELIQGNILRAEPFPSRSHRNISVPVQKLVQRIQERGVGNIPKPLSGGHELLLKNTELSGSGEECRALRRVEPIVLQRKGQKDKQLVAEQKSFIHGPEERVGNDPSFGEKRPSSIYQLQKCPKTSPKDLRICRKVPRAIREREKAKPIGTDLTHKGRGSPNWNIQQWKVF